MTNNVAAGVKRKPEDQPVVERAKVIKTEVKVPVRPTGQTNPPSEAKQAACTAGSSTGYRGTARSAGATNPSMPAPKPVPKRAETALSSAAATTTPTNGATKPKRGFASLMEKAKAAQEATKAAGSSTIKHKPVEKLTKRDRRRMQEEAVKQKAGGKAARLAAADRSRSGTPLDAKAAAQKKALEPAYKGTMKKPAEKQESTYKGTMNKAGQAAASAKPNSKKNLAQDRYGGYASWSDLDDAEEDEDEGGYGSDASSDMMDAGFDDMEAEERRALQAAKKEDQEALAEEEKHRREKEERKRKLQALSKSAAARKKF